MKRNPRSLGICLSIATALAAVATAADHPDLNGRWVMNSEKSQGPPAIKEVLTYRITGNEEHYIIDDIEQDGRKLNTEYSAKVDGKEYPNKNLLTGEVTYVSIRWVFPRVEEVTNIRHVKNQTGQEISQVTSRYIRIFSSNGNEYTSVMIGPDGVVQLARVFDRQAGAHSE